MFSLVMRKDLFSISLACTLKSDNKMALIKVRVLYMLSTSIIYFQFVDIDFNTR